MTILILNNQGPNTGIGNYAFSLYLALKRLLNNKVKMLTLERAFCDFLLDNARDYRLLLYTEEFLKVLGHITFAFTTPKGYKLYHVSSPHLGVLARRFHPCVFTVHDFVPFLSPRLLTDFVIKKSMEDLVYSDGIICISERTKSDLLRLLDVDPTIVSVIYHGVNHNVFKPRNKEKARRMLGLPGNTAIVLHVGTEEPRKNIATLLKIFHGLQKELPNIILVRLGEKTKVTSKLIKKFDLERKVLYFKKMSVERIAYLYNAADALLFPSYHEGFGMPLLEAAASGCPIVASNKASIPEVVGDAGILLNPFNVDSFVYWMQEILENRDLRMRLTKKGLERSKRFSWEKCAMETLKVYESVLGKRFRTPLSYS